MGLFGGQKPTKEERAATSKFPRHWALVWGSLKHVSSVPSRSEVLSILGVLVGELRVDYEVFMAEMEALPDSAYKAKKMRQKSEFVVEVSRSASAIAVQRGITEEELSRTAGSQAADYRSRLEQR